MKPDPARSILNRAWPYVSASHTDLRLTFARVRAEQEKAKSEQASKVRVIRKQS